jgi:hypothetical protein
VAEEDANVGLSERACGGDEGGFAEREDLAANDACHGEPFDEAEREDEDEDAAVGEEVSSGSRSEVALEERVEDEGCEDDEDEARDGVENLQQPHHGVVDVSSCVAGDEAVEGADDETYGGACDADGEGDARALKDAGEEVASVDIGSEEVGTGGRGEGFGTGCGGVDAEQSGAHEGRQREGEEEQRGAAGGGTLPEAGCEAGL